MKMTTDEIFVFFTKRVIPVQTGIYDDSMLLDSRLRGNDRRSGGMTEGTGAAGRQEHVRPTSQILPCMMVGQ
jgi:hypothetical protein